MRDPLLDLPSTPPSSSSAEHSSREPSSSSSRDPHRVQRSLEMFNSLQQAMYNTYASLPPDAQHALLQRAAPLGGVMEPTGCATCDQFLSDRGMRAVLLLKPNIVLFSTDATPSSAGPIWPEPRGANGDNAERTCDCLTSSLGCHGCGTVVGYHIVQPCARCTASVQKHQRSANHHRYVFHHNEVVSSEREYFPGERGITGARYVPSASRPSSSPSPSASPVPPPASESEHKDAAYRSSRERRQAERDAAARARAEEEKATRLRRGDTLYWHNLVQGGERTEPVDPKTRPRRVVERVGR
ncbi:zinc finger, C2H2-type domain containing protein [Pseudohyphozyma bogoriensis]|nr:zinc finger, C2H2-type domain containing protein [Pseudohyphozyma bogoriensis]